MDWELLNKTVDLFGVAYGSDQDSVKLDGVVWTFVCDPDDGYRSYCGDVRREPDTTIGPFFERAIARVVVREWEGGTVDGFELVDDTGHVWLTVGTDDTDDYYPSYVFDYTPKEVIA